MQYICIINLLRWHDVPRTSKTFGPKLQYPLSFKYILYYFRYIENPGKTNNEFISNFYPVSRIRIIVYTVWSLVMVRKPVTSAKRLSWVTCYSNYKWRKNDFELSQRKLSIFLYYCRRKLSIFYINTRMTDL